MNAFTQKILNLYQETDMSYADIAREFKVTRHTVRNRLKRLFKQHPELDFRSSSAFDITNKSEKKHVEKVKNESISEEEFLEPYDWITRVNDGLNLLEPGSNSAIIKDEDFRRSLEIPKHLWKKIKNRNDMKPYQVHIKQSLYWCQPETAENLRKKIDLIDEVQ